MTSRSLKNRPTTVWAIMVRATATSLMVVALATVVSAQTPSTTPSSTPAKTSWQPFPVDPPTVPPLVVPSPAVSPPPAPTIGTRVVVYQKPAGGDQPVANTTQLPSRSAPKEPDPIPMAAAPNAPKSKPLLAGMPEPAKPSEVPLFNDKQLDAEILKSYNTQQMEAYNRSTEENKKPPTPIARDQMPPSDKVREMLTVPFPRTAPRSVLAAAPSQLLIEPGYVVHRRLMFEEKNSERYGWNLGVIQPAVSVGYFYKDVLFYPMKLASNIRERYDTSAGTPMPGSPVPYTLYPPEITFGGMAIGSVAVVGAVFLLP